VMMALRRFRASAEEYVSAGGVVAATAEFSADVTDSDAATNAAVATTSAGRSSSMLFLLNE
jgi:hypothetical protein